jgi:hypothetical protein
MSRAIAMALLLACCPLFAQKPDAVWIAGVTGEAIGENLTPQQARERALSNASAEALRQVGVRIDAVQLMQQSEVLNSAAKERQANDAFVNVVRLSSQGIVTGRRNEVWTAENIETRTGKPPLIVYRVKVDLRVTMPAGKRDEDFAVKARLSQPAYRSGERVLLSVSATKDCHVLVFNIAEDSVRQLHPVPGSSSDMLSADMPLSFPPPGLRWKAAVPEGWESSQELIMVIATKRMVEAEFGKFLEPGGGYAGTRHAALMELLQWLASLPQDQVAYTIESMEILASSRP